MLFYSFNIFLKKLVFLLLFMTLFSCIPNMNMGGENRDRKGPISQVVEGDRPEREEGKGFSGSCPSNKLSSKEISLKDLEFVDSENVGEYLLQGRCSTKKHLVYVTVNGRKTTANPKCDKGRWKVTLNLTTIVHEEEYMIFLIEHNREEICKKVRVSFIGPKNYVPIPPVDDNYESSFYVMKYEAKVEEKEGALAKAISVPEGLPATARRVSQGAARILCQNNGSRFDLIQNSQWQNIARSIEDVDENWSQGQAIPSDNNLLNCGVIRGRPRSASADDNEDCALASCQEGWDENRRTHLLPHGGGRIWDICGNVGEMMKDKYRKNHSFDDYIYRLSDELKELFGPKKTYKTAGSGRTRNTWNLGYADVKRGKDLIVRGVPGRDAGIFSVDVSQNQSSRRGYAIDVGFRCVYIP